MTTVALILAGSLAVAIGMIGGSLAHRLRTRHKHGPWVIVGRHYEPPAQGINARGYDLSEFADLFYGYTTVTERCDDPDCQLVRTRQVRGQMTENVVPSL